MKKLLVFCCVLAITIAGFAGCGQTSTETAEEAAVTEAAEDETATADESAAEETAAENIANAEEAADTGESAEAAETAPELGNLDLEDGTYTVTFTTDNSMFHVNETLDDTATLTVKDGYGTVHVTLESEKIVNLFYGYKADAEKDGAELLEPTIDTVTYEDGDSEEVYGFDIPVPYLEEEYPVALVGTKGTWYDHMVVVSFAE